MGLHDRQVGAPVGVENGVKAHAPQRRGKASRFAAARRQAEALADADTHRGRGLHDHVLLRVAEGGKHTLLVAGLPQRAHRADDHALPAEGAGSIADGQAEAGADHRVEAAVFRREDGRGLDLLADADAAAAEDALVGIAGDGLADVQGQLLALALIGGSLHAQLPAQGLELAVLVARAGQTAHVVVGEQQLVHGFACLADAGRVGLDYHAVPGLHHAGRLQVAGRRGYLLHHADAAGAVFVDAGQVAQARDVDMVQVCGLQDGASGRRSTGFAVDSQGDISHLSYLLSQRRHRLASARASSSCMPRFRSRKLSTASSASSWRVRNRLCGTMSPLM